MTAEPGHKRETITLAGGCFWCLEAIFESLRGVVSVEPGYAGGHVPNPSYEHVCTGKTGHAEAVRIVFDPQILSFQQVLEVFFATHDPTTLNRQGSDVGTQYRSAIFYETPEQKALSERMIMDLRDSGTWDQPIVTEVRPLDVFYPAEAYHTRYYSRHREQPYCQVVINPKLRKLTEKFADRLKV